MAHPVQIRRRTLLLLACAWLTACGVVAHTPATDDPAADGTNRCGASTPILDDANGPTGFVRCADGAIDRVEALPTFAYGCSTDADCQPSRACVPTALVPDGDQGCVPATCRSNADCKTGECGFTTWQSGTCPTQGVLACREAKPACRTDADCNNVGDVCVPDYSDGEPPWTCQFIFCDGVPDTDSAD